jgi:isoprenylcysteine carboxyl methyltransferase (ICMT) family protein YpbQ
VQEFWLGKVWVIRKGRIMLIRQVRVIKTWIYSWMRHRVLFQEEYKM